LETQISIYKKRHHKSQWKEQSVYQLQVLENIENKLSIHKKIYSHECSKRLVSNLAEGDTKYQFIKERKA